MHLPFFLYFNVCVCERERERLTHVVSVSNSYLLLSNIPFYQQHSLSIDLPVDEDLGYFQCLAIMDKVSMNVHVQVFMGTDIIISLSK